jgi:ElaB/YqjD/DUF883 family membrane-anchored ribosome-binding protein
MEGARKQEAKEVEALKADLARLREEMARGGDEQKAKLQTDMDELHQRLRAMLTHTVQRSEKGGKEIERQIHTMEKKAAKAPRKAKAAVKARVKKVRKKSKSKKR